MVDTSTLTVWFKAPLTQDVRVDVDGKPRNPTKVPVQAGLQIRLPVSRQDRQVSVAVQGAKRAQWRLKLAPLPQDPDLQAADRLRKRGELDAAQLRVQASTSTLSARGRVRALGMLARIHLAAGRIPDAVRLFRESIQGAEDQGMILTEAKNRSALSYTLTTRFDFGEALAVLEPLRAREAQYAEVGALRRYYEFIAAQLYWDIRTALQLQRETLSITRRLAMADVYRDTLLMHVVLLHGFGRFRETVRMVDELERRLPPPSGCPRADALNNLGLMLVQLAQNLEGFSAERVFTVLNEAVRAYEEHCQIPEDHARALFTLAEAELRLGNLKSAREHLDEARRKQATPDRFSRFQHRYFSGELALAEGRNQPALQYFQDLETTAARFGAWAFEWRAALGQGQALERLGQLEEAKEAFLRAERWLDDRLLVVPLGEGRTVYAATYSDSSVRLVEVLLRLGQPLEAAAAARRSRRRTLAPLEWSSRVARLDPATRTQWYAALARYRLARTQLEAQADQDWSLAETRLRGAGDAREKERLRLATEMDNAISAMSSNRRPSAQLAEPQPGELVLLYHPVQRGWVGFSIREDGLRHAALSDIDLQGPNPALSQALLYPFKEEIAEAKALRILAFGPLLQVDFHALPFEDAPLIERMPVVYGIDLPTEPSRVESKTALVIGNPTGDLPEAGAEAIRVAGQLSALHYRVTSLLGDQADFSATYSALSQPPLKMLHYSGHAVYEGLDGQGAGLPLGGSSWLSLVDVLALPSAPENVFLSGCSTGRDDTAAGEGLGLAQAFLTAGSRAVVATTRAVADTSAREFTEAIYRRMAQEPNIDLASAVRATQIDFHRAEEKIDWAAYRVLVP